MQIKNNTTETPKIDIINFISMFRLVITRNEMMILFHTTKYIHTVKKHDTINNQSISINQSILF